MTAPEQAQQPGPTPLQHRTMHRFWKLAGVSDRDDRIALTGAAIGVTVGTSSELTPAQAEELIAYQRRLAARGQLAAHAARWLAAHRPVTARCGS